MTMITEDRQTIPEKLAAKRYKMQLRDTEYNVDFGGRLPAGAVVLVDEVTAIRWYERNVADPAEPDAPTYAEENRRVKRDEFLKKAKPAEGVFDQAMSRFAQDERPLMREMPQRGRPRGRRPASDPLAGAEVVTDIDEDDGD